MATGTSSAEGDLAKATSRAPREPDTPVRTFLIADVRGYTRFTQEHGDEAAGELAGRFATLAREAVLSCGGELIELRGDEALCVFGSARQALRAAVELQTTFRRWTDEGPSFPLPIGIGLDAGEAVPIEGGYRGGALNTAARLCSLAGPGQILATETVVSLARQLEGIRFLDRRPVWVKGLDKPVRVIEVVPEQELPPLPEIATPKRRATRRTKVLTGVAVGALAALVVGFVINRSLGQDFLSDLDANSIGVIDARAARITSQLEVGSAPSALAGGGGFMWAASEADGTVSRIHPVTRAVRTLSLDSDPGGVAYGGRSLWVTMPDERAVAQYDPRTLKLVQKFPVGNAPGSVAADASGVWVANTLDGTVSRISLDRGVVMKPIPVGVRPVGIAVGAGAVWVTDEVNGNVLRIDSRSGKVVAATHVGNGPTSVVTDGRQVWVANRQDGTVSKIDPDTNRVSATIPVGESPVSLAAGSGSVWVASEGDGTIARIDAGTNQPEASLSVGSSPHSLALSGDELWVATSPSLGSHRGGVLRVESDLSECDCTDPAFQTDIVSTTDQSVFTLAYDGLVAYRRKGGIAGGTLVGDLALDIPPPTDGGRTYTFQLRPDILYSNGAPVQASDFRSSMERALTVNRELALNLFGGIVGAATCKASPPDRCDLSSGIGVDDKAGTITIRLTEADPDFVHKLAFPLAFVVPAGSPLRASRTPPVPGTGPYQVASSRPGRAIRLVRNRYFRVWSQDASPDGYPDEIRLHPGKNWRSPVAQAQLTAVERGQADWTQVVASVLPAGTAQGLLTRYPGRLHSDPRPVTFWTFLNTRVPPFDDVRVRRALNYALDRAVLQRGAGGARPIACQLVPPGFFPGYRPYCPYTLDPNPAGTWTAPDLAKARALVAASGTRGMRVEVVGRPEREGGEERALRYQVSVLQMLGYRSSLRLFSDHPSYLDYTADSRNRAQLGSISWFSDTLTPSNFLHQFSCAAFRPASPDNLNRSEFCDPGIDARMRRAAALQASDPARANALWAAVDRALVDRAALVPTFGGRSLVLVSERVGNYQFHPLHGTLLDQLWVK